MKYSNVPDQTIYLCWLIWILTVCIYPENTIFNLITTHTPISAQLSSFVVFMLQPTFLYVVEEAYVVGTHLRLNCLESRGNSNEYLQHMLLY